MTIEQIEAEALKLPAQARAELLGRLMRSLADALAMDQEVAHNHRMPEYWVSGRLMADLSEQLRNLYGEVLVYLETYRAIPHGKGNHALPRQPFRIGDSRAAS